MGSEREKGEVHKSAMHSLNHIIKFADDTTVVGLISKNDESAYSEEVQRLTAWCGANNLTLNVDKKKEMVVDFRRAQSDQSPLIIDGSSVEIVKSTKFLGVHLADNLTWSLNTSSITKKAQQHLYFLRRLRKAHFPPPILSMFYRGTIESILSSCITAWFGNCTVSDRKSLQRILEVLGDDCVATSNSSTIIKSADDTVVVGLISNNDEAGYLLEIKNLERWCKESNLLLNISKTKKLIVDINRTPVEKVDSFRYLGVHIIQDLSWSFHINTLVKNRSSVCTTQDT
ncbi:gastrula zinc finger protein XlCGF28.1-like [Silurus asotus]|uniref:Gastrula zinc finger protein XlCGF28.1-like n=1 Tax=Silurus asotus TaxID=30991 RepID=A0AAD5B3U3_SILAS|nr:gastrula zinc finger protein XlCGF28.1-like [Silurus asotus]